MSSYRTLQDINATIWYRLLKVVVLGAGLIVAISGTAVAFAKNGSYVGIDRQASFVACVRTKWRASPTGTGPETIPAGEVPAEVFAAFKDLEAVDDGTVEHDSKFLFQRFDPSAVVFKKSLEASGIDLSVSNTETRQLSSSDFYKVQGVCSSVSETVARLTTTPRATGGLIVQLGLSALAWFCTFLLIEIMRRVFYYVVLGTFRPTNAATSAP